MARVGGDLSRKGDGKTAPGGYAILREALAGEVKMIGVYMQSSSMTVDQYNEINEKLMKATHGEPAGMIMHSCFREGEGLAVFDVWETQEKFEAMAPILMPIIAEVKAEMGPPQFVELIDYLVQ
jgi:hypothetical protein